MNRKGFELLEQIEEKSEDLECVLEFKHFALK
jgi:hypothetical protein